MDFAERVIPKVSSNYMFRQARARYLFAYKLLKNKNILDIGCGTGYATIGTGIDIDPEAICYAKKHYKANFLVGDATNLPFENGTFDAVTSFETIEHIKDYKKYLTEIKRVLKPGGKLILSTPRKNGLSNSQYHIKEFSFIELDNLLRLRFKSVKIYGQGSSKKAQNAWNDFMISQKSRQKIVNSDTLRFRKLIPKYLKELIWRYMGNWFFKRDTQESLSEKDFPIGKYHGNCQTLIAVCSR